MFVLQVKKWLISYIRRMKLVALFMQHYCIGIQLPLAPRILKVMLAFISKIVFLSYFKIGDNAKHI